MYMLHIDHIVRTVHIALIVVTVHTDRVLMAVMLLIHQVVITAMAHIVIIIHILPEVISQEAQVRTHHIRQEVQHQL